MAMLLSPKGAAFIRGHEGFVAKYYLDPVKVPTIGIGFTWRSTAFREWWAKHKAPMKFGPGATMTREEAEDALIYLCRHEYGYEVNNFLDKQVPQHVFDGTTSPVYNLGRGALKWKWAAAVKAGDYAKAASLLRTTGTTAKGKKLAGLVRRRAEEAMLIEHGKYTGVPAFLVDAMADGMLVRKERGPAVAALLKDLAALGYYDGTLDDLFGYGAEAAVLEFQRANGLKPDGYAGPKTLAAIAEKLAQKPVEPRKPSPAPSPAPKPEPAPAGKSGGKKGIIAAIVLAIGAAWAWMASLPCEWLGLLCK